MSAIIEAKNLNLGYNDELVIKDATFSINAKEFVFITGASGSEACCQYNVRLGFEQR